MIPSFPTHIERMVPRSFARLVPELVIVAQRYPQPDDVTTWLLNYPGEPEDGCWIVSGRWTGAPCRDPRVQAVAARLRFQRWLREETFLERGGVL